MVSGPVFYPRIPRCPGVELVLGSSNWVVTMSGSASEMRELGRECARRAVRKLLGESLGELSYSQLGAPLWSAGETKTHISISHTGQFAIGAAAQTRVGVDIEFRDRDVSRLVKSFTPIEHELSQVVGPIALLCAKEAAGKSAGVGLAGSIARWSVMAFTSQKQTLLVRDLQTGDQWRAWISLVEEGGRSLQCSVAQPADPTREKLLEIYESAHVEIRQVGSGVWLNGADAVRERAMDGIVITAWNPGSDRPSVAENEKANDVLLTRLREYCSDVWEADGFSPDGLHREPGFIAWGMDPEIGIRIAREFSQFAIFYFDASGDRVLLSV